MSIPIQNNYDKMAKYMGIKLQVRLSCTGCDLVKARVKGVPKVSNKKATKEEERVCFDTTGTYPANPGGTGYWVCA